MMEGGLSVTHALNGSMDGLSGAYGAFET